jgi:hypothetical protein
MDRAALARARIVETKQLALVARDAAPPCRLCAHSLGDRCGNVAYSKISFEASTGSAAESYYTTPKDARSANGLCGPEGLLFEQKSEGQMAALRIKEKAVLAFTWAVGAVMAVGLAADFMGY